MRTPEISSLGNYWLQFWRWSEPGKITCRALGNRLCCFTELWAAHSHLSVLWVGIPTAACDKLWTGKYLRKTQLLEDFQAVTHLSKPVSLVFLLCCEKLWVCFFARQSEWSHQSVKALGNTHVYICNCSARQHLYIFISAHGHHLPQFSIRHYSFKRVVISSEHISEMKQNWCELATLS